MDSTRKPEPKANSPLHGDSLAFVQIPLQLIREHGATAAVLRGLVKLAQTYPNSFTKSPSAEDFAKMMHCDKATVMRTMKRLVKAGVAIKPSGSGIHRHPLLILHEFPEVKGDSMPDDGGNLPPRNGNGRAHFAAGDGCKMPPAAVAKCHHNEYETEYRSKISLSEEVLKTIRDDIAAPWNLQRQRKALAELLHNFHVRVDLLKERSDAGTKARSNVKAFWRIVCHVIRSRNASEAEREHERLARVAAAALEDLTARRPIAVFMDKVKRQWPDCFSSAATGRMPR